MTDAAVIAEDHDETSVPALWETARWFMRWLLAVCGSPCALVAEAHLSLKERREIVFWLRPVEALVRRLLVAEAARIAQMRQPARTGMQAARKTMQNMQPPAARPRFCRVAFPDPRDSGGWAVRFSVFEPAARPRPSLAERFPPRLRSLDTHADVLASEALASAAARHRLEVAAGAAFPQTPSRRPKPSRAAGNPWPLAKRIEAVLRVLLDPGPYARRLARRLPGDAARLARSCKPPPGRPPGTRPPYGDGPLRHAGERALRQLSAIGNPEPERMPARPIPDP